MRITIEFDDETEPLVYEDILDYYLAIRNTIILTDDDNTIVKEIRMNSFSETTQPDNLRDIAKELQQSLIEIQDFLKNTRSTVDTIDDEEEDVQGNETSDEEVDDAIGEYIA